MVHLMVNIISKKKKIDYVYYLTNEKIDTSSENNYNNIIIHTNSKHLNCYYLTTCIITTKYENKL